MTKKTKKKTTKIKKSKKPISDYHYKDPEGHMSSKDFIKKVKDESDLDESILDIPLFPHHTERKETFETGSTRVPIPEHYHAICPELERRVSMICAEGFDHYPDEDVKYAELSTGRKGLPLQNLIKHGAHHWNMWRRGDRTEDHLAKVAWALQQIMHQENPECQHFNILIKPEHKEIARVAAGFEKE